MTLLLALQIAAVSLVTGIVISIPSILRDRLRRKRTLTEALLGNKQQAEPKTWEE